ncbi:MAG: hypothetical protein C5B50_17950 [Verrucomicrobia bacterium]|nr:MAG: hypothetical protein C5B50_17950 [Verrucomicrobiota bacterium]
MIDSQGVLPQSVSLLNQMATDLSPRHDIHTAPGTGSLQFFLETERRNVWLLGFVLIIGTLIAYLPVWHAGFIWDDDGFLYKNPLIHKPDGLYRFWFTTQAPDYFPLTSTSLWLEWRLWGMNPLGYHLANVLLHAASSVLLWRVLAQVRVPGAWFAAAIFAVHPVNVQSVAWITERKNTLAMVFVLLCVLWYVKSRTSEVQGSKFKVQGSRLGEVFRVQGSGNSGTVCYLLSLGAFLLALLSKTSVAPLPFVLLLCEWWLNMTTGPQDYRITRQIEGATRNPQHASPETQPATRNTKHVLRFTFLARRLAPFFALSLAIGLVSFWFQSHRAIGSDVVRTDSFLGRLAGAGWAFWFYLSKAIWPMHLSPVYPRWEILPQHAMSWAPAGLAFALGLVAMFWRVTSVLLRLRTRSETERYIANTRRAMPPLPLGGGEGRGEGACSTRTRFMESTLRSGYYSLASGALLFGLVYFVLMLGPVLGFLNIYFMRYSLVADHWQYFAIIGPIVLFASVVAVSSSSSSARASADKKFKVQSSKFKVQTVAVSAVVVLLAILTFRQCGYYRDIETFWRATIAANPNSSMAHNNLGHVLLDEKSVDEAIAEFETALQSQPRGEIHNNLAHALLAKGQMDQALEHSYQAVQMEPGNAELHFNLGEILFRTGRKDEGIAEFRRALEIEPKLPMVHNNLGYALMDMGKMDEALEHFRIAVQIEPESAHAQFALAYALARSAEASPGNFGAAQLEEAITHFREAVKLEPGFAPAHNALGRALAKRGQLSDALLEYQRALDLEPNYAPACNNLAWLLATAAEASFRNGAKALDLARHAEQLTGGRDPAILRTLAAAYAETEQFVEAIASAQRANELAKVQNNAMLLKELEQEIKLYNARLPFRSSQ